MGPRRRPAVEQRLLEAWVPPDAAGEPIGCVATTFTFDPVFFEEHCLARFLRLETDPREDGAAYLIEREEKLAQTTVTVLVDRSTADGSASPRWDVLAARVPGGILHAKISVLGWHGYIRVLTGSANLTEPGYRKNQEIFGVLDFHEGGEVPFEVLDEIITFLESLTTLAPGVAGEPGPKSRLEALVGSLRTVARRWTMGSRRGEWPQVVPLLLGPARRFSGPVPERLGQLMRDRTGPAHSAWVLSPFFDQTETTAYPATQAVIGTLRERGDRRIEFLVPAELLPDGRLRLRAPRSLIESGDRRADVTVRPVSEEVDREFRPLHAKAIWLWNDSWHAYMVGSSNFTAAGLGLSARTRNVEANLVYLFPEEAALVHLLEATLPTFGEPIGDLDAVLWEPVGELDGQAVAGVSGLPPGFEEALFEIGEEGMAVSLRFGANLPLRWQITGREGEPRVYASEAWARADSPATVRVPWTQRAVPTVLVVKWWDETGRPLSGMWPVNVRDLSRLPPPDELRDLSLETLVEILSARLPLHEVVPGIRKKDGSASVKSDLLPEIDPHRRVNTETFLLQRTKRVARAVERLVEKLNRPVVHRDALAWRLRGPVGPLALAQALSKAARSSGEACFLLSEVALALRRVDVRAIAIGVPAKEVRQEIEAVKAEIDALARRSLADPTTPRAIVEYVEKALEEARR